MAYSCIGEIKDLVDTLYGVAEGLDIFIRKVEV